MTLYVLCPDCSEERPGMRWTSQYGGNDPDVYLVPCETCGGGHRQPGCGEIALSCDGCPDEAEEIVDAIPFCATCAAEYRRETAEDVFGEQT
jgi:hypothetical protein